MQLQFNERSRCEEWACDLRRGQPGPVWGGARGSVHAVTQAGGLHPANVDNMLDVGT